MADLRLRSVSLSFNARHPKLHVASLLGIPDAFSFEFGALAGGGGGLDGGVCARISLGEIRPQEVQTSMYHPESTFRIGDGALDQNDERKETKTLGLTEQAHRMPI